MANVVVTVDGQEIEKKQDDFATRKRSGEDFFISFDGLPNIDPILKCLNKDVEVYEQVLSDTRVRAAVRQRKAKITGMEWSVSGKNTPEDQIEILTNLLTSYNMRDTISQVLNASGVGRQVFEINWGIVGGLLLPVELIAKPNHWFAYNEDNELMFKPSNDSLVKLPENKFIVARNNPTYENPYGEGYLPACFWPVTFRKNGWGGWSIFTEKYGMPLPIIRPDEGTQDAEVQDAVDAVAGAVQDAVVAIPKNFDFTVVEAAKGGDSVHSKFIDAANTDIAIAVLGTNLTMEIKGGSLAASGTSKEVADDQVESDEKLTEGFIEDLFAMIYKFNWSPDQCPGFNLFPQEDVEKERSERDKNLLESNPSLKFSKIYYQKNYNLEEEDFDIVEPSINQGVGND